MKSDMMHEKNTPIGIIHNAFQSKLLSDCSDGEIAQRLSMIYFLIGLRPKHFPTKEEDKVLFTYIRNKYGNRTIDELYLAFDLAINEQLDIDDYKVYDQFSIEYLVRIMNSYRRYVSKTFIVESKSEPLMLENNIVISEDEKRKDIEEFLSNRTIDYKLIPLYLYDWMEQLGYIRLSKEDREYYKDKAIHMKLNQLMAEHDKDLSDTTKHKDYLEFKKRADENFKDITPYEKSSLNNMFKKAVLIDHHKKQFNNGTNDTI